MVAKSTRAQQTRYFFSSSYKRCSWKWSPSCTKNSEVKSNVTVTSRSSSWPPTEWSRVVSLHQFFTIFFSMILKQALKDLGDGSRVYIRYCLSVSLFNLQWLQAYTKILEQLIWDLSFVNNAALGDHTERALQHITFYFIKAAQLFGQEVSLKKTEVLKPAPPEEYCSHHHWPDWVESRTLLHLFEVHHHVRWWDQQSRQQAGKGK